jgi:hypothetical protein
MIIIKQGPLLNRIYIWIHNLVSLHYLGYDNFYEWRWFFQKDKKYSNLKIQQMNEFNKEYWKNRKVIYYQLPDGTPATRSEKEPVHDN